MRRYLSLLLLPVLSLPVLSVSSLPARAADPDVPLKPGTTSAHHARETWEQHFTQANLAHDGHLTLEEARGGYTLVAKHFEDIDVDHKGYVTQNDIRAWRIVKKTAHRLSLPLEGRLKPRNAMQLGPVGQRPVRTSAAQTVAVTSDPEPQPQGEVGKD